MIGNSFRDVSIIEDDNRLYAVVNGYGIVKCNDNHFGICEPYDFGWRVLPCYFLSLHDCEEFLRSLI